MFDDNFIIGAKFDRNAIVADFIKQYKGTQSDCYELVVNDKVIPRFSLMRDAVEVKIRERQVKFNVRYNSKTYPIVFGLSKTIKSLKEHLRDVKKVPVDQHTMTFNGNDLNDGTTIKECKIVNGSVLDLCIKEKTVFDLIKLLKHENSDNYDLAVDGKVVSRIKTLREACISETSKFEFRDRRTRISFTINTLTGKRIRADFYSSDTILIVKEYIVEREGIPIEQQRLIFAGRQLNDDVTLLKYGIKNDSEMHIVLHLCGGT